MDASIERIRSDLQTKAGVEPSRHWLMDCLVALRHQNVPENKRADECLYQILHHDLRDVIRTFDEPDDVVEGYSCSSNNNHNDLPSVRVRSALRNSKVPPSFKAELPTSFRLMVQIEEFLDVSQNATARLEVGPSNSTSPTATGNQSNRCLKLLCSDGYNLVTGLSQDNGENEAQHINSTTNNSTVIRSPPFLAMEVCPIPQMSTNSHAGLKVVLTGPITVRHGVLLLHPGNASVLGGHVPELTQIQLQALEQAKRVAGVGVDPTIRALIGNPLENNADEANDQNDEGEAPSRDVETTPYSTLTTIAATSQTHQSQVRPNETTTVASTFDTAPPSNARSSLHSSDMLVAEQQLTHNQPSSSRNCVVPRHPDSSTTRAAVERLPAPINQRIPLASAAVSRTNPYVNNTDSVHAQPSNDFINPYTNPGRANMQSSAVQRPRALTPPRSNPYSSNTSQTASASTRAPMSGISRSTNGETSQNSMLDLAVVSQTMPIPSSNSSSNSNSTFPITPLQLPFAELRSLMVRIRGNPSLHRQYQGRTFISSMRQVGPRVDFNIVKIKTPGGSSQGKKKDKHYEYLLICKFGGQNDSSNCNSDDHDQNLLTCQVGSSLQEPFFGLRPKEMRELSRIDRQGAQERVKRGGDELSAQLLAKFTAYELTLCSDIPDELAGSQPMLMIIRVYRP